MDKKWQRNIMQPELKVLLILQLVLLAGCSTDKKIDVEVDPPACTKLGDNPECKEYKEIKR